VVPSNIVLDWSRSPMGRFGASDAAYRQITFSFVVIIIIVITHRTFHTWFVMFVNMSVCCGNIVRLTS